jgi:hypothetical protein
MVKFFDYQESGTFTQSRYAVRAGREPQQSDL